MIDKDLYKHFIWGENKVCHPNDEFIIKLDFPRCYIRYSMEESMFTGFDEFYSSIAEVQWIDGERPSKEEQEEILTDAWNYMCLEERILEGDMRDIEEEEW